MHSWSNRKAAARPYLAFGTNKAGHVLDNAQDWETDFFAERYLFSHVEQADLLRSGDDDGAVQVGLLEVLNDGQMFIGRARWCIDEQVLELAPVDVSQKLLDEPFNIEIPELNFSLVCHSRL